MKVLARIEVIGPYYVVNLIAYENFIDARRALGEVVRRLRNEAKAMVVGGGK